MSSARRLRFVPLVLAVLLPPVAAPALAEEPGLEKVERGLSALDKELARLESRLAERTRRVNGLVKLEKYVSDRLAPAVGFPVTPQRSRLPASHGSDVVRIRYTVERLLSELFTESVLTLPAKAYRRDATGGFVLKDLEERVRVGYLDPKSPPDPAKTSLQDLLEIQRIAAKRMLTDIRGIIVKYAILDNRTRTEINGLREEVEIRGRAVERKENDVKALKARNAGLEERIEKLEAEIERLKSGG